MQFNSLISLVTNRLRIQINQQHIYHGCSCYMLSLKTECINIADLALKIYNKKSICERFEPRSHFKSMLSLIVLVNVVVNRTVVVDSD